MEIDRVYANGLRSLDDLEQYQELQIRCMCLAGAIQCSCRGEKVRGNLGSELAVMAEIMSATGHDVRESK